jgi:hypothetical protein
MANGQNTKILLGEAGELLVLTRLLRYGVVAGQSPRGWKTDDLFSHEGLRVQVKTTDKGPRPQWMVGYDLGVDEMRFYVFVDYREPITPICYVLPSGKLEEVISNADECYYQQRPASKRWGSRTLSDGWNHDVPDYPAGWLQEYRERWELIPEIRNQTTSIDTR